MAEVSVGTERGQMPAYSTTPAGGGPWPGVGCPGPLAGSAQGTGPAGAASSCRGIDHDIMVYPGAGRGFRNQHGPEDLTFGGKLLAKLGSAGYHEPSAQDPRRRILAYFRHHLNPEGETR